MRSLDLLQQFAPEKINYDVSEILGDGADGQVFSIKSDPSTVIKYSILYDLDYSNQLNLKYSNIDKVFNFIKNNKNKAIAKIYDFGLLYKGVRTTTIGQQEYIIYFSTYEKLKKISEEEKKALHSLLDFYEKNEKLEKVKNEMKVLSKYFDFNHEKYVDFYQNLCLLNFHHNDMHIRNIMKDESSNLKLIDFDKSTIME